MRDGEGILCFMMEILYSDNPDSDDVQERLEK